MDTDVSSFDKKEYMYSMIEDDNYHSDDEDNKFNDAKKRIVFTRTGVDVIKDDELNLEGLSIEDIDVEVLDFLDDCKESNQLTNIVLNLREYCEFNLINIFDKPCNYNQLESLLKVLEYEDQNESNKTIENDEELYD